MKGQPASENNAPGKAWDRLIDILGVTTGIAALIYLVGATTVWLRLSTTGYPTDLAIERYSSTHLLGIGLRGVLTVAGLVLLPGLAALTYVSVRSWVRRRWPKRRPLWLKILVWTCAVTGCVAILVGAWVASWKVGLAVLIVELGTLVTVLAKPPEVTWIVGLLVSVAVIAIAVAGTWRGVGLAVAAVIALTAMRYCSASDNLSRGRIAVLLAGLGLAAGVAAVAWQVEGTLGVPAVVIDLDDSAVIDLEEEVLSCKFPYFGQTDGFVYLGEIRLEPGAGSAAEPCNHVFYTKAILEIPRGDVSLRFVDEQSLLRDVPSPWEKAKDGLCQAWRNLGGEPDCAA